MENLINKLTALAEGTRDQEALNNAFYVLWMEGHLDFEACEIFAHNYFEWIRTVPRQIAYVFLQESDLEAQCETVKNLFDEMGFGDPQKVHYIRLKKYLEALLTRFGGRPYRLEDRPELILDGTRALIAGQKELFGHEDSRISYGALLAQEWQAYTMLAKLYEGARRYASHWPDQESFHEDAEYFYIHIGSAEKEHKVQSIRSARKFLSAPEDFTQMERGYRAFLEALAAFWAGISREIMARNGDRVPESAGA